MLIKNNLGGINKTLHLSSLKRIKEKRDKCSFSGDRAATTDGQTVEGQTDRLTYRRGGSNSESTERTDPRTEGSTALKSHFQPAHVMILLQNKDRHGDHQSTRSFQQTRHSSVQDSCVLTEQCCSLDHGLEMIL